MPVEVTCTQCGHTNPLGRMFCMKCGAQLELATLNPANMKRQVTGKSRFLGRIVRLAITLALLYAIIMILRPVVPTGSEGNPQDVQRLRQKLGLLKGAVLESRPGAQRISEVEVNSYLAELVGRNKDDSAYVLKKVNVAMNAGQVIVVLVSKFGPATLTYEITGVPGHSPDHHFDFLVRSVRLGQLPMPGALGDWLSGKAFVVFSKMSDERSLLDKMDKIEIGQGEARVETDGRP